MKSVEKIKGIPSPEERPDLYDAYDCQERTPLSDEYLNAVLPEHVKAAIAAKKSAKGTHIP